MTPDDDQRVHRATRVGGVPVGPAQPARRKVLPVATVVLVGVTLVAVLAVLVVSGPTAPAHGVPTWQMALGLGLSGAGLVLQLTSLVVMLQGNHRRAAAGQPHRFPPSGATRKRLLAQIRGTRPVEPADLPRARDMAGRLLDSRTAIYGQCGLIVIFAGRWVEQQAPWQRFFMVLAVAMAGVAPLAERDVRRARRFLHDHPGDDADDHQVTG